MIHFNCTLQYFVCVTTSNLDGKRKINFLHIKQNIGKPEYLTSYM